MELLRAYAPAAAGAPARRAPGGVRRPRARQAAGAGRAGRPAGAAAVGRADRSDDRRGGGAPVSVQGARRACGARRARAGAAGPSSSSTPTTTLRSSSLRSSSDVAAIASISASRAGLGLARVELGERVRQRRVVVESRMRVARPSAANEPGTLASSSSAPSRSPAAASERASGIAASARPGSSSSARRRLESPPSAISASASEGTMPVQEALDLHGRERADELVDDLAVLERLDGRDRLDPEGLGQARVGVGVDLDEIDLAGALVDGLLDHGPERAARAAPLGPEVDDHGLLEGALDDVALEGLFSGVDGHDCEDSRHGFPDRRGRRDAGRRGGGAGEPGRAAARADRDAALRGDGLAGAGALRPPRDRLRRARPRPLRRPPATRATTATSAWPPTCSPCSTTAASTAPSWPAPRWARTRSSTFALTHPERVAGLVIMTPAYDPEDDRPGADGPLGPALRRPAQRRRRGLRRGLRHAERAREVAGDDRPRPAPAARRPRPPGRARRRAAGRPALAPVRGLERPARDRRAAR